MAHHNCHSEDRKYKEKKMECIIVFLCLIRVFTGTLRGKLGLAPEI